MRISGCFLRRCASWWRGAASRSSRTCRPVQRQTRAPRFAARTLKCHRSLPGHAIAAVRELKSSLCATAGGKEAETRSKRLSQAPRCVHFGYMCIKTWGASDAHVEWKAGSEDAIEARRSCPRQTPGRNTVVCVCVRVLVGNSSRQNTQCGANAGFNSIRKLHCFCTVAIVMDDIFFA